MKLLLFASAGGAIGAGVRFLVNQAFAARGMVAFPWATLTVNVLGGFLMGAVMILVMERLDGSPELRTFLATGVLGGLTTFSAFTYELSQMIAADGAGSLRLIAYIMLSLLLSLAALYAGMAFSRAVIS
ncbi:MAG TPA: CrcB family protein [Hyphomicrobium sp.]|nr:CrcB family protein [Hyphomicrobium sp.]